MQYFEKEKVVEYIRKGANPQKQDWNNHDSLMYLIKLEQTEVNVYFNYSC